MPPFHLDLATSKPQPKARNVAKELRIFGVVLAISISQGFITSCDTVWNYIYKDNYTLSIAQSSMFSGAANFPWIIKPLWGVLSDCFPFAGYKRKSYLLLTSLVVWLGIALISLYDASVALAFIFFVCLQFGQSFQSVVGQAIVVEYSQSLNQAEGLSEDQKKQNSSAGISVFYTGRTIGKIFASLMIMLVLVEGNQESFAFGVSFIPLCVFIATLILPEKRLTRANKELIAEETPYSLLPEQNTNTIDHQELATNQAETLDFRTNMKRTITFLRNPLIMQAVALVFLNSFVPQFTQAKFYYYNYLNFSASYLGLLKLLANGADIIAIGLYSVFLSRVNLKKFYSIAILVNVPLTLSMLILILRINLNYGIPDKAFVAMDTFVSEFNMEMTQLPILALASRLCPKNIEAIVFAIFIAAANLGGLLSSQMGALIIWILGVDENNFGNYWMTPIITAVFQLCPFLVLCKLQYEETIKQTGSVDQEQTEAGFNKTHQEEGETLYAKN